MKKFNEIKEDFSKYNLDFRDKFDFFLEEIQNFTNNIKFFYY